MDMIEIKDLSHFILAFVVIGIRIVESRAGITKKFNPMFSKILARFMVSLKNLILGWSTLCYIIQVL